MSPRTETGRRIGFRQRIGRFVTSVFVIFLVLYIGAFLLSRTDGFRYSLETRLGRAWEAAVEIDQVRMTLDGRLAAQEVRVRGRNDRAPCAHLSEVQWRWHLPNAFRPGAPSLHSLRVQGGRLRLVRGDEGEWTPPFLAADAANLRMWLNAGRGNGETPLPAGWIWQTPRVRIEALELLWEDSDAPGERTVPLDIHLDSARLLGRPVRLLQLRGPSPPEKEAEPEIDLRRVYVDRWGTTIPGDR